MKKTVVVVVLVFAALALFATEAAFAQTAQPPVPGSGLGMGFGNGHGPLHEYMVKAMAQALGIPADEFESRRAAGETAYQIALASGLSADKIPTLLSQARASALDAALADGAISQAQAAWMKSRPASMGGGTCNGTGHRLGAGMGHGARWPQTNP